MWGAAPYPGGTKSPRDRFLMNAHHAAPLGNRHLLCHCSVLVVLLLVSSCAWSDRSKGDWQAFKMVKIGMSRARVEQLIGKPEFEVGDEAYYGRAPFVNDWQSPQVPASIVILYSNNIVRFKDFFPDEPRKNMPKP